MMTSDDFVNFIENDIGIGLFDWQKQYIKENINAYGNHEVIYTISRAHYGLSMNGLLMIRKLMKIWYEMKGK